MKPPPTLRPGRGRIVGPKTTADRVADAALAALLVASVTTAVCSIAWALLH